MRRRFDIFDISHDIHFDIPSASIMIMFALLYCATVTLSLSVQLVIGLTDNG